MSTRLTNHYIASLLAACESDVVVAERFARVNHFLDHPLRLIAPPMVLRVARANLRGRRRGAGTSKQVHTSHPVALP